MSWGRFPWLTTALLALVAALTSLPLTLVEYNRAAVKDGEIWRLASGQLVHWTPRMALLDLGLLAVLGGVLESLGERKSLASALGLSLALAAVAVQALPPHLGRYRGSSGLAVAVVTLVAMGGLAGRSRAGRLSGGLLLALLAAKLLYELGTARTLFAGALPEGVSVAPAVHLAGLLAGGVVGGVAAVAGSSPRPPAEQ